MVGNYGRPTGSLRFQPSRNPPLEGMGILFPNQGVGQFSVAAVGHFWVAIRIFGGWSEVLSLRKRGEKQAFDQRILGDNEFVQEVISGLDDLVKRNLRLSGQRPDINTLTEKVCEDHNISVGELRSGGRRHEIVKVRQIVSWVGIRELGYSGAELARYLGVTTSCVNRFISTGNKPDMDLTHIL